MSNYERTTVRQSVDDTGDPRVGPSVWAILGRIVTALFGILQVAIILRIVLLLLGADHANAIVSAILSFTNPFVEPFRGMFRLDQVSGASGSVLDVAAIVAIIGWTLVEALILSLLRIGDRRVGITA